MGESSKHIVQIIQLLEERSMSFSFCLNKADTLVLCGMALLYQTLDLKHESRMMKDNVKLAKDVIKMVDNVEAPGSFELKQVAGTLIALDEQPQSSLAAPPRRSPDACMAAPPSRPSPPTSHASKASPSIGRHIGASRSEANLLSSKEKLRRISMPQPPAQSRLDLYRARSRPALDSARHDHPRPRHDHRSSLSQAQAVQAAMIARASPAPGSSHQQNLDYLSLASATPHAQPSPPAQARSQQQSMPQGQQNQLYSQGSQKVSGVSQAEWEALLGSLDSGQLNLYDAIYGGPGIPLTETPVPNPNWPSDSWDLASFNVDDFAAHQGALSLSDESLSSGEEMASSDMGLSVSSVDYTKPLVSHGTTACATVDGFHVDALDDSFGL